MGSAKSDFLRELERAMVAELRETMRTALKVGVLVALGFTEAQMKAKLGIDKYELREAKALLKRATARFRDGEGKGYAEFRQEVFRE